MVYGTGRRAGLPMHPAAGKTGTSQDFRDAWFIGYTAHLTAGVWMGNDNGTTMNRVMGGSIPAEIWREVMLKAHQGRAPLALPGTHRLPPADIGAPVPIAGNDVLPWQFQNTGSIAPPAAVSAPQPPKVQFQRPAAAPYPRKVDAEPSYPASQIDGHFVARMAGEPDSADTDVALSDGVEARFRFVPSSPPPGMMALGRGEGE
jgi:penicillin-binding protein 1A